MSNLQSGQVPSIKQERKMTSLRKVDWPRAYRDWRVLAAVFVILVVLVTYLITGDFTWRPGNNWHPVTEKTDKQETVLPPVVNQ